MSKAAEWAGLAHKVEMVISGIERPTFHTLNGSGSRLRSAWVTNIDDRAFLDISGNGRFSASEALALAKWITDTFSDEATK